MQLFRLKQRKSGASGNVHFKRGSRGPLAIVRRAAIGAALVCLGIGAVGPASSSHSPLALFGPRSAAAADKASWTVMLYLDADCDLEAAEMQNIDQMLAVGSTDKVNLLLFCDRSPKGDEPSYTNRDIANIKNWSGTKIFYVKKGELQELDDWGGVNLADPATLTKFLNLGAEKYPADHYMLALGDHGAAWSGICFDETHHDDKLSLSKLHESLNAFAKDHQKMDLLGFDACLMSNLETMSALAQSSHTVVSSEECEPGDGWQWTEFLTNLTAHPDMSAVDLGKSIADTFRAQFGKPDGPPADGITLAVADMDNVKPLEDAVNDLATKSAAALKDDGRAAWLKVAKARAKSEEYGIGDKNSEGSAVHDLLHYAQLLKKGEVSDDVSAAADAVQKAVKDVVVYNVHSEDKPNANGVSVYFPANTTDLANNEAGDDGYQAIPFSKTGQWMSFLSEYGGVTTTDDKAPEMADVKTDETDATEDKPATVTDEVTGDDVNSALFVITDQEAGKTVILSQIPQSMGEDGKLEKKWNGKCFSIGDQQKELICPISRVEALDEEKGLYSIQVPVEIRQDGGEWRPVKMTFEVTINGNEAEGHYVTAFEESEEGPANVDLHKGDEVRPVYLTIDANGEEEDVPGPATDILKLDDGTKDLAVGMSKLPKGSYEVGFAVSDLGGKDEEKLTTVNIP